jgi:hypothetical protein
MSIELRASLGYRCVIALAISIPTSAMAFQSVSSVATGGIQGQVTLSNNKAPLAGATVTAYRISPAPKVSATATTTANGSFAVSGLATGQYGICVMSANSSLVDPCNWLDLQTTVSVANGNTSSGVTISIQTSSPLTVRVNDAAQYLSQMPTDPAPPHVLVGAFDSKNKFHPAVEIQKDSSGISYQLTIPNDLPVRMLVYSGQVQLTNAQKSNAAVPAQGFSQMVVQPSNQPQLPTFTFSATGRN